MCHRLLFSSLLLFVTTPGWTQEPPKPNPEHAYLKDIGRAEYVGITDDEALAAFHRLCRTEGIIPALESAHALAAAFAAAPAAKGQTILVNLSGRGDKDVNTVEQSLVRR